MKPRFARALFSLTVLLAWAGAPAPALADQRYIVRAAEIVDPILGSVGGLQLVSAACSQAGCTVQYGLDGGLNRLFLVTTPHTVDPQAFVALLPTLPGIKHAELDVLGGIAQTDTTGATTSDGTTSTTTTSTTSDSSTSTTGDGTTSTTSDSLATTNSTAPTSTIPPALLDQEPIDFFGAAVRGGYVRQPANGILGIDAARQQYGVTGLQVTVAVIDTGVDPTHPVLQSVLLEGYDFTRGSPRGSELTDVNQSPTSTGNQEPGQVNQSTIAVLDQSTIAVLDDAQYSGFGHGTMVAGVIHRVAPAARILPLKAFRPDGKGYMSDVLRAIYFATNAGAKVVNMSFSFKTYSAELATAVAHAASKGVIPVASAGNEGTQMTVYPAALNSVIGVAATTDYDVLSQFSNFGIDVAWIAAPGEGVITTYPFGAYAAAWGTSFSAPFAAGTAALLAETASTVDATQAADAEGYAIWISPNVNRGRLDIRSAVKAWRTRLGLE